MPFENPAQPPWLSLAIRAWNLMGGFEWSGLDFVTEMLGVTDIEMLIHHLALLRDFNQERSMSDA